MKLKLFGFTLFSLLAIGSAHAQKSCSASIVSCGCSITRATLYTIDADLSVSQGLTPQNACIEISVAHAKLILNNHAITGAGKGIGIHILPTGTYTFLEGGPVGQPMTGWEFGIESDADNVIIDTPFMQGNSTGILLKQTYNNKVSMLTGNIINHNSVYGIWIDGGNSNQIDSVHTERNGIAGVYVGCSSTGPTGTPCSPAQVSSGNVIYHNYEIEDVGPYSLVLEAGSTRNTVMNNIINSAFDGNTNCAKNLWFDNAVTTANAACIH